MCTCTEQEVPYWETDDFPPLSLQFIFDNAWQHFVVDLATQGCGPVPYSDTEQNAYLTDDGLCCAIGVSIPKGHPAQHFEGEFSSLVEEYPKLFTIKVTRMSSDRLDRFQRMLHDGLSMHDFGSRRNMRELYEEAARGYGLDLPNGGVIKG